MILRFANLVLAAAISLGMPQSKAPPLPGLETGILEWLGELAVFCRRVVKSLFTRPFETEEFFRQMDFLGAKSMPLVALAGAATGVVLSLQTRDTLTRFGAKAFLPSMIVYSLVKEMGPVITGLVASGRLGAGIGAELGSMKVTNQIDAMEVSAVDPYKFLAATRILACIVVLPLLTLVADASGILMGWIANTLAEPISLRLFFNQGTNGITFGDFLPPTLKTMVFGFIIGLVSSFLGMRTRGGTEGVGRAATGAVVLSSLFIILADVILVRLIVTFFS